MTNKDLGHVQSVEGSFPSFYCLVWNTNSCLSLQAAKSPFDLRAERIALKRLGVGALFCYCVSFGSIILSRGWLPKVEASEYLQHPTHLLLNTFKCNLKELTTKSAHFASDRSLVWRQCGLVVRALALRSGDPGFKTRSDHSLNLILVVPDSTSQLHL